MYFIFILKLVFCFLLFLIMFIIYPKKNLKDFNTIDLFIYFLYLSFLIVYLIGKIDFLYLISIFFLIIIFRKIMNYILYKNIIDKKILRKPNIIIEDGIINFNELSKLNISLDLILEHLHKKKINDLSTIKCAYFDYDNNFIVSNDYISNYPLMLIINHKINIENLRNIGKDIYWINNILIDKMLNINDIYCAFYSDKGLIIITNDMIN